MSFRTRLISFFLVIVLAPMLAVGVLVFRLIDDSGHAQTQARASGLLAAATSVYASDEAAARAVATSLARVAASIPARDLRARMRAVTTRAGLARVQLTRNGRVLFDMGSDSAVAPGMAAYRQGRVLTTVRVSSTTADQLAGSVALGGGLVVRQGDRVLGSNLPGVASVTTTGTARVGHVTYAAATGSALPGFAGDVRLTALADIRSSSSSVGSSRALAVAFVAGFLFLALAFAIIASRGLQSQLGAFLRAARRLAGGDFSAPVPIHGEDEFAMLATEFNRMSEQLAERLEDLRTERARLRESIRRSGEAFAANLDREGLLKLAMRTAVDAVEAEFGRLSLRDQMGDPLVEVAHENSLDEAADAVSEAESRMLQTHELAQAEVGGTFVASAPMGEPGGYPRGVLTVGRRGRPFPAPDLDLLTSLAWQASLALENVELHEEVRRQAVTDKLTGLTNHGRFQEVLGSEIEQVRRYRYPVGLIMLDIDNFKQINDTYGHPQGDQVLQAVARVLRDESREADWAARYGGEEMALILPHTDLEGAYVIAERVRTAVAGLRIPVLGADELIEVTASLGVAATSEADKSTLIAEADAALYRAKREGKNRTMRATPVPANVATGE
jgi:diguanylate cyclase (GGDEF)-like protein